MDLSTFLHDRRPSWKRLEELLERAESSGLACLNEDEAVELGNLYRRAASDLNQAQTFVSGDATVRYLNDLVARAYLLIYGKTRIDLRAMLIHYVRDYPGGAAATGGPSCWRRRCSPSARSSATWPAPTTRPRPGRT